LRRRATQSGFLDSEQARGVAAQDCRLLFIRQGGGGEDVIDRMLFLGDRMVGAQHDLARADLRHQMP
jgi:hypothetical protein